MRWLETLPGLGAADAAGAFRSVRRGVDDLGVRLEVAWILADSLRTLVGVRLDASDLQVTAAWLTDDLRNAFPLVEVLDLSEEGAAEAGAPDYRTVLVFGPLSPHARRARLEVQRLEAGGALPTPCEPLLDPFQPMDEALALQVMRWQAPANPLTPVPLGNHEGCWGVEMEVEPAPVQSSLELNAVLPLGSIRHRLIRLEEGLTGWRLAYRAEVEDPPPPGVQMGWLRDARSRDEAMANRDADPVAYAPGLRLALKNAQGVHRSDRHSGPWGPLQDRFYDFFPPCATPQALLADQIVGLTLEEPWGYEFHPKKVDDPPADAEFPHHPFPFKAQVWAEGLYWQEEFMLLVPRVSVLPGPVAEAWPGRCRVTDPEGNAYECLGQAWATLPRGGGQVHGLQFPPLHRLMDRARLEVESVDLILSHPLEVPCHVH